MTQSTLTKNQTTTYRVDLETADGPAVYIVKVRFDDQCGNGHNTFAITCDTYDRPFANGGSGVTHKNGSRRYLGACGCNHEAVAAHFPALAPLAKWHLTSTDGPMHYLANTIYLASNKDYRGLAAGERRQLRNGKTGMAVWERVMRDGKGEIAGGGSSSWVDAESPPDERLTAAWEPVWVDGVGKPLELDAARAAAVWLDATDDELTAPGLEARLTARLPGLMAEFRAAVESLGFVW